MLGISVSFLFFPIFSSLFFFLKNTLCFYIRSYRSRLNRTSFCKRYKEKNFNKIFLIVEMFLCRHLHLEGRNWSEKKKSNELKWCYDIFLIPVLFFCLKKSKMWKSKSIPWQSVPSGRHWFFAGILNGWNSC